MASPPYPDLEMISICMDLTSGTTFQASQRALHHQRRSLVNLLYPSCGRISSPSHTVQTIEVKKITYPMTSKPPELWILETNQDGLETWRSIDLLGPPPTLSGPRVIRTRANQWRLHYTMFNQSHHHCRQSPLTQYFLT